MKVYAVYRGPFGEQFVNNLAAKGLEITAAYELTLEKIEGGDLSKLWENPADHVPKDLPPAECDLLLVLGIPPKLGDLVPTIAERLGAKAVIYPIGDHEHAPEARKTIEDDLRAKGIGAEFPEPFCSLAGSENPIVAEFVQRFGRPEFEIRLNQDKSAIKGFKVVRDTPCGSAGCALERLAGHSISDRAALARKIHEEHQNDGNPNYCLAGMDPNHPYMQRAGDLLKDAVFGASGLETAKDAILRRLAELGEAPADELRRDMVGSTGDWGNPKKHCEAPATVDLYIEELIAAGKVRSADGKLRLA